VWYNLFEAKESKRRADGAQWTGVGMAVFKWVGWAVSLFIFAITSDLCGETLQDKDSPCYKFILI